MCTEHDNFELHGRENMKSHIYVLTITEGKYARGVLGGGNEMGGLEKKVMKFGGYICLKSFNLKSTLIVLHI